MRAPALAVGLTVIVAAGGLAWSRLNNFDVQSLMVRSGDASPIDAKGRAPHSIDQARALKADDDAFDAADRHNSLDA